LQNVSRINKDVDLDILETSVELLSLRHQVLKSAFTVLKSTGAIKQVILENRKPAFNVLTQNEAYTQDKLDKVIEDNILASLDLQKDSLFRVTIIDFNDARFMVMHAHHIIMDGWCLPVLINDAQRYYSELQNKSVEELTTEINNEVASETSYAQYASWIRKQDTNTATEYWQNLLSDASPAHIFSKEKKDNSRNEDIISFVTPLDIDVESFAKLNKVSQNSVFEAAFSIALQKFSNSDDVIFDKTISGRSIPLKNIENTVGPFINTVPVRVQTNDSSTLLDILKETQNQRSVFLRDCQQSQSHYHFGCDKSQIWQVRKTIGRKDSGLLLYGVVQ
jgi:iturin family lipopeptide synthetase B